MKDKAGLIIGLLIGLFGLYRIDYVLYLGLNYFGKYVFFVIFNIFVVYLFWILYKKTKGVLKQLGPLFLGLLIFIIGLNV